MNQLPRDLESCHRMIERLQSELAEARRQLAVHVENQHREMKHRYGKGASGESLLAFGQTMNVELSEEQRSVIEAELAAEDAMRHRRSKSRRK